MACDNSRCSQDGVPGVSRIIGFLVVEVNKYQWCVCHGPSLWLRCYRWTVVNLRLLRVSAGIDPRCCGAEAGQPASQPACTPHRHAMNAAKDLKDSQLGFIVRAAPLGFLLKKRKSIACWRRLLVPAQWLDGSQTFLIYQSKQGNTIDFNLFVYREVWFASFSNKQDV